MQPPRILEVARSHSGARLDAFLAQELQISRRYARRLLERERVQVEGRRAPPGIALRAGQRVEVAPFRHPREGPRPDSSVELQLLAESSGLVAIDKPAGLPSHPLDCDEGGTALGGVLALRPQVARVGSGLERGLVHRLDTGTSGVLVFATEADAWQAARREFAARRVYKRYRARVHGTWSGPPELCLRLASRGARVRVVESGGIESITRVRLLAAAGDTSLLEIEPLTGVRHQIRAALAHLGFPVVGDELYGSPERLGRHLLHAELVRIERFEAHALPPAALQR